MHDLSQWTARPSPERTVHQGRYVRLEPLDVAAHGEGLYTAASVVDGTDRYRWLLYESLPTDRATFQPWLDKMGASKDPLYFTVIDQATNRIGGRQAFMRMDPPNGVIEIGSIYWAPPVARAPGATEALYLFARHAFDDLGYRRFEWKTNNRNEPSKRAAVRFGFQPEGVFRQHLISKGENRDTA